MLSDEVLARVKRVEYERVAAKKRMWREARSCAKQPLRHTLSTVLMGLARRLEAASHTKEHT
jgi:hypothetical protein